jgi:hypothetical protein
MWTIPTLNTRETATVIWAFVVLVLVLWRLPGAATTLVGLFRTAATGRMRWLVLGGLIYVAMMIYVLKAIGYWHTDMIGETSLWFLGGGVLALPRAVSLNWIHPGTILRELLIVSAGLEFLANVHTFLLPVELVLVPLLTLLDVMFALVKVQPELKEGRRPIVLLTNTAVVATLGSSVVYVVVHLARFETAEYLRALALPVILTVVIAPLICGLRLIILWESTLTMLKTAYLTDRQELYRYVRARAFQLCGISLRRAGLFENDYWRRLRGAQDEDEVDAVLSDFESAAKANEPPKTVQEGIEWDEALGGGVNLRGLLARSVVLASLRDQELEKAATALEEPIDSLTALADRLDSANALVSITPTQRAQVIRILAQRERSIADIELMAGEIGVLAVLEGVDPRWLADRFDAVMSAWGHPAEESNVRAAELHELASRTTVSLADVIDVSLALSKWDGRLPPAP